MADVVFGVDLKKGTDTVVLVLSRGDAHLLSHTITEQLQDKSRPLAIKIQMRGKFEGFQDIGPHILVDENLSSKAWRLLKMVEETPGLKRGKLMQRLASDAAEFGAALDELMARGWITEVKAGGGRGRPPTHYFSTRPGAPNSQTQIEALKQKSLVESWTTVLESSPTVVDEVLDERLQDLKKILVDRVFQIVKPLIKPDSEIQIVPQPELASRLILVDGEVVARQTDQETVGG